jgi:DNA-binding SARP family transcriptional activator
MMGQAGSKLTAFVCSLAVLAVLVVGVPAALMLAARERFGGSAPLHGVASPMDWEASRIKTALTDRLTDQTVADIVIRLSLLVTWAAVLVLLLTIVAELVHMVRHDGLAMPDIRGLGLSQSAARVIAAGLLVVVPMFATPSRAVARDGARLLPEQRVVTSLASDQSSSSDASPDNVWVTRSALDEPDPGSAGHTRSAVGDAAASTAGQGRYVVRGGDSIYGIAERFAGPDQSAVADYAEQLIELNIGNRMSDGQLFTNAAFIDVGWVLELPTTEGGLESADASDVHVVVPGESLWSIAEDHLDDGGRWPEIYEANQGRTFDDGRRLVDPDLIQPGWELDVPPISGVVTSQPAAETAGPAARPDNVWSSATPDGGVDGGVDNETPAESPATGRQQVEDDQRRDAAQAPVQSNERVPVVPGASSISPDSPSDDPVPSESGAESVELLTFTRAAMLSAGVLTLLAVRRRNQLRRARPRARLPEPGQRPAGTERALRAIDTGDRLSRVDVAVRAAAGSLIEQGSRVLAALVTTDGDVELRLSNPARLASPWHGTGAAWQLDGTTPIELLTGAADRVGSPCPTMIQLGRDLDGRDVYVDLEACEAIEVGGPADQADSIVTAIATTLAGSTSAEVTTLIGLGVADEAFLDHRLYVPVLDSQRAFGVAREAVGSTASAERSTFELRSRAVTGEAWEPAVVLAGSTAGTISPPRVRTGLAVVSASPIHGPSSRLAPDGDAWTLLPLDLRMVPIGLSAADVAAIAELVHVADPVEGAELAYRAGPDDTIIESHESSQLGFVADTATEPSTPAVADSAPNWQLMVRLLGPVKVVSADGEAVSFERSKTRELVAWLATHRRRSTRTAARTALWELDVRDATFANVVSEARRSLARLVEPPPGDEWVGRTMTEDLPLHDLVCTDVDLVEAALDAASLQPPAQAIATLSPAVELIDGLPFEGTSYLWPDPEGITSNLVLLATSATAELAAHCLSIGDINGVFQATGRGLSVLPGHEELIGLRMQAHARAGDNAGVRQEWESYERVITSDPWSDGEPSPKLVDLRRQLLNPSR